MNNLQIARALFGDTMGFHIIFAMLGVGLPILISIFEFVAIKNKNQVLIQLVRHLSYIAVILTVIGVISGTIVAVQFALIWPGFFEFAGSTIGMAFSLEGYMFFLEAVFLTWYVFSWDRLTGFKHWALTIPTIIGSTGSAFMITAANSWMNNPTGFDYINGSLVNPHPWTALFNSALFYEFTHSIFAYYLATSLLILGFFAWVIYKNKCQTSLLKILKFIMVRLVIFSLICLIIVAIMGDLSAKYIAKDEPRKFAAIEAVYQTKDKASLNFGGNLHNDGSLKGGINLPIALSVLAGGSPKTVVKGLIEYPKDQWPPLIVHSLFDIKMILVPLIFIIPALFLILYYKQKKWTYSKPILILLMISGPIAIIIIELGWMLTEIGRQPYIISNYLLTSQAVNNTNDVKSLGILFPITYILLFIFCWFSLKVTIKKFKLKEVK